MQNSFFEKLKNLMDDYVHCVYKVTKKYPKEEIYGVVSQIRRASLSVILNYIEGYSRKKKLVMVNFFEISYGSLQESKYLIKFSLDENYLNKIEYERLMNLAEQIGAMLWTSLKNLQK
jgi:four helix bundle protein